MILLLIVFHNYVHNHVLSTNIIVIASASLVNSISSQMRKKSSLPSEMVFLLYCQGHLILYRLPWSWHRDQRQ
jgi:hypothetical protein